MSGPPEVWGMEEDNGMEKLLKVPTALDEEPEADILYQ